MEKTCHYFSITVTTLKNGRPESSEVHGAYSLAKDPAHAVDKIISIVKGQQKAKYPNDDIEVLVSPGDVTEVTKEVYEAIHNKST